MEWFENLTFKELNQYVGDIHQLAGARSSILNDGPGSNMRICEVNTAAGLNFTVLPDRGMDISLCRFKGVPLAPMSKVGMQSPENVLDINYDFFKNFHCGLLTTCGLNHIGPPSEIHGLHGPISNIRAENFSINEYWLNDDYIICLKGKVRQATFFSENLQLEREIKTSLKSTSFTITDTVTNYAFKNENLRILYHVNFGFPLLSPTTRIVLPKVTTLPRDEVAKQALSSYLNVLFPQDDFKEQVYLHKINGQGLNQFSIENETIGVMVTCKFDSSELPYLTQWNQFGKNEYVLGIEPGLDWPLAKPQNSFMLEPLENFSTSLTFEFSSI